LHFIKSAQKPRIDFWALFSKKCFFIKSAFLKSAVQIEMTHIIVLAVLIILLVLLRHYVRPAREHFESSKSVVICKADWCGHCKHAAPEFDKLSAASPIKLKDGSTATVKVLDADKDKAEISKYAVKGFPTILIVDGSNTTEYPGERTHAGVLDFLNQTA